MNWLTWVGAGSLLALELPKLWVADWDARLEHWLGKLRHLATPSAVLLLFVGAFVAFDDERTRYQETKTELDAALQELRKINPQPILAGPRPIEARIASPYQEFPYGLEIILQTDTTFDAPVKIKLVFDGIVGMGDCEIYNVRSISKSSYIDPDRPNVFVTKIDRPSITAKTPIGCKIYSQFAIKVERLEFE